MVYLFRGVPQNKKGGFFVNKLKCASFFAGVGGIDLGFEESDGFETVYANEFDAYPSKTFELNFPNIKVDVRDIREVKSEEIPEFDVMLAGFPCQAFSIAGYRKGFDDEKGRGELFFELTRIIEDKRPRICFFENVKNLVGHDNGNTFRVICEQLDLLGYKYTFQVLNAMYYGNVAQNRERIYIVAFREEEDYDKFHWPLSIPLKKTVRDIIDFSSKVDDKYYYVKGKYKGDIYEQLVEAMKDDEKSNPAIYQCKNIEIRRKCEVTLLAIEDKISHICELEVRNNLCKMMFLTLGKIHMHDWNELHTEYSYKDKMFLNEIWSKYGWLHFKNLLYVINQMHITELLPEIILPLNESLRKCGENYADCKEMIKANAVIINKIITKAFLDFNDDIKCDHELVKAFEEVLETLVGFGMEEAAVILDEFRVH